MRAAWHAHRERWAASRTRRALATSSAVVVSNDCWGAEVYRHAAVPYNTPFVGLFVPGPDFLRLVRDPGRYLGREARLDQLASHETGYPVGHIDDVRIDFMHHDTFESAVSSWVRRSARASGPLRIKGAHEKDGFTDDITTELVEAHGALVLCHTSCACGTVPVDGYTPDGRELFAASRRAFDLRRWVASGVVKPSR